MHSEGLLTICRMAEVFQLPKDISTERNPLKTMDISWLTSNNCEFVTEYEEENNHMKDKMQLAYNTLALRATAVHM